MAGGKVPSAVAPFICGARLHAGVKKDGGLRPIAVGNIERRLVSKCFVQALNDRIVPLLSPHQLGVGIRGGCETAVNSVKAAVARDPSQWVLQVDLINAFNQVDRSSMLAEVEKHLPDCLAWASTCYGQASNLQFGPHSLSSTTGVHQGCPLAGHLFAITLQPVVETIATSVPDLHLHVWLHDDGTMVGKLEDLGTVVDILVQEGPKRGLFLSTAATVTPPSLPKSSVWCPTAPDSGPDDPLQRGIPNIKASGITVLGSPVGDAAFVEEALKAKIKKVENICSALPDLQQPHLEFCLLRSCLSLPKIVYLLRTTDTSSASHLLDQFDSVTRESLSRIIGGPISEAEWQQAKLPITLGGVGLKAASDHGGVAHACSLLASHPLLTTLLHLDQEEPPTLPQSLLDNISVKMGEEISTESLVGMNQRALSHKIDLHLHNLLSQRLAEEGDDREIARLASLSIPDSHAGDWLTAIPSPSLALLLRSQEFIAALRYRLGHALYSTDGPCPACGQPSDRLGDHALNCAWNGERIARHNWLRDELFNTAVAANLGPTREGRALLPGSGGKPADVFIPHWAGGKDAALDVTVVNPLQAALVHDAAITPGHALTTAHNRKLAKSLEPCQQEGITFIPMAVESLGAWHKCAINEIKKLGCAKARHISEDESTEVQRLFQKLSVALMRGNCALMNNRVPTPRDLG